MSGDLRCVGRRYSCRHVGEVVSGGDHTGSCSTPSAFDISALSVAAYHAAALGMVEDIAKVIGRAIRVHRNHHGLRDRGSKPAGKKLRAVVENDREPITTGQSQRGHQSRCAHGHLEDLGIGVSPRVVVDGVEDQKRGIRIALGPEAQRVADGTFTGNGQRQSDPPCAACHSACRSNSSRMPNCGVRGSISRYR